MEDEEKEGKKSKVKKGRTDQWWKTCYMLHDQTDDNDWKKNLRLSRMLFNQLTDELSSYIAPNILSPNHRVIPTLEYSQRTL